MKRGFTIIEILVVLVILGIIMAFGTARHREFQKRQTVISVKRLITGDLRVAQSDALNGRKPEACGGVLLGYSFEITGTAAPARYEVEAICTGTSGNETYAIKEVNVPEGVSLTAPSVNPIIFRPLTQGTNLPASTTATISIIGPGLTDSVVVSASGAIR